MVLNLAGLAAYLIITGCLMYLSYQMGKDKTNSKWSEAYSKLYRAALLELMRAYELNNKSVGKTSLKPMSTTIPKKPSNGGNVLQLFPKKGDNGDEIGS